MRERKRRVRWWRKTHARAEVGGGQKCTKRGLARFLTEEGGDVPTGRSFGEEKEMVLGGGWHEEW